MRKQSIISLLRRGAIEAFVLRTLGVGLSFLMHSFVGRLIGSENYGTFSYAIVLAGLLSVVVPLGWPMALMRFIAEYREKQQWNLLNGALVRASQITILSSLIATLLLLGVASWQGISSQISTSLHFAALLVPLTAFVGLRRKTFQGLQKIKSSILLEEIILPLIVLSWVVTSSITTATDALLVYFGAALIVCSISSVWLWRSLPVQGRTSPPAFETRKWMTIALTMVLGGVSQVIINRTDVLMLGYIVDMEAVGLYNATSRIATLNTFVLQAVSTIAVPMLTAAYHGGRMEQFKLIIRQAILWSIMGSLLPLTIMIFWPQGLLSFFGSDFIQGKSLLQVLAVGQFINAATGPVGFALLMSNREREFAHLIGIFALLNLIGNMLAIPSWGATGAAVVSSICVALLNSSMYILTRNI